MALDSKVENIKTTQWTNLPLVGTVTNTIHQMKTKKRLNEICGLSQTSNNLNEEKVRLKLTALFVKIKIVITSHDEIVCRFLPSNLHLMN